MDPARATVVDLLAAATAAHPEATAVVAGDGSLTYAELDRRAGAVAGRLVALGVGPDVPVGVGLDRCTGLAVALVGALRAGGACLPLDPAYPPSRLGELLDAAAPAAVVTRAGLADRFRADVPVLLVDEAADDPPAPPAAAAGPGDVAYVIFTSGSTGVPKGVLLTHGGLVSHHRAVVDLYGLGPGDRVLQFCSLGFDASIEEMFPSWAAGATVVHRPEDVPLLGPDWLRWLRDRRITVLNLPTAYWHAWVRDLDASGARVPDDVRLVVVGGESALGPAYRTWRRVAGDGARVRWVNAYGPTETTCMSTFYEPPADWADQGDGWDPPIGRPLPGTILRVVDEALRPVAAGVTGELLIGGPGLARGYLGDPELTARRFVDGPPRMYRTGDLVRELPGGDLAYVGRADGQVKVQGFRVESGEVEAALARHPAVAACAVVAREDPPEDRRLFAFVVSRAPLDQQELRRFLADRLPAHMVPAAFGFVDDLPLTEHGKVDRNALPSPVRGGEAGAARSPAEERMAGIWAAVLGVAESAIGPDDDFFELGGHSLLATQVVARIRDEYGTETPLRVMFESPTLAGLAAAVAAEAGADRQGAALVAVPRAPGARYPLSRAQEQMWVLERRAEPPGLYNFTVLHRFDAPVDRAALRRALAAVVARHEILRTGIGVDEAGAPYQFVVDEAEVDLTVVGGADEAAIAAHEAVPFDLARPPLVRAALVGNTLAVTFDHVIADGTGAGLFVRELLAAYAGAPLPPPPTVQFADFAVWQRASVGKDVLRAQLDWWAGYLAGAPLGPAVPFDHLPDAPARSVRSSPLEVGAATRSRLEELARGSTTTVFAVVVAAVAALLGRAGDTADVVLSTTVSGRTRAELEGLIGTFSGMSRIRTDLSGDPPFVELVARARDALLGIFEHQDVPFMQVRHALYPDFPTGPAVAAALPVDLQYFHTGGHPPQEFFFRGQLHPLAFTLLDDGHALRGDVSYKVDFYEPATVDRLVADLGRLVEAVAERPGLRLSELPVSGPAPR